MITLRDVVLRRGAKVLLDGASVTINPGEKVGLVGRNGAGKSSLFRLLDGQLHEDKGEFNVPAQWRMAQVAQDMPETDQSATTFVIEGDTPLLEARREVQAAEDSGDGERMAHAYMALHDAGEHDAAARAQALILGLGFRTDELERPVNSFSGGWRMRLQLARALMCPSDLLLLDEPTNHLDLDALVWLEAWLQRYSGTMLVISHDREFLDAVTNVTVHIEHAKLNRYGGNYSRFEDMRAEQMALQQAAYARQQEKMAHLQKFIDRFKAKASKAKQAQSRVKALERMEKIGPVLAEADFNFEFAEPQNLPNPMLALADVDFGYPAPSEPGDPITIVRDVSRSVLAGQRIGILGANGQGKSTVVKTVARMRSHSWPVSLPSPSSSHRLHAHPDSVRGFVQACVLQRDWTALHETLVRHPDAFAGQPDHLPLSLDNVSTRDLGDFAAALPPQAHLPVISLQGGDLTEPDQRISALTAHRHSWGLRLDNCRVVDAVWTLLADGARQGQAAGHRGLLELAWTATNHPGPDLWFGSQVPMPQRLEHIDGIEPMASEVSALIAASSQLSTVSLSGVVADRHLIALAPVLAALACTRVQRLSLALLSSSHFSKDIADEPAWAAWKNADIALEELHLSGWSAWTGVGSTAEHEGLMALFSSRALQSASGRGLQVVCRDMDRFPLALTALGQAMARRRAPLGLDWDCCTDHQLDWLAPLHPRPRSSHTASNPAALSLSIHHLPRPALRELDAHVAALPQLHSLRLGLAAPDDVRHHPFLDDVRWMRLLQRHLDASASLRHLHFCSEILAMSDEIQSAYGQTRSRLRLQRCAERLLHSGFQFGSITVPADIARLIAQHLHDGPPSSMAAALRPLALTHRQHHAAWQSGDDSAPGDG